MTCPFGGGMQCGPHCALFIMHPEMSKESPTGYCTFREMLGQLQTLSSQLEQVELNRIVDNI
jgi:hypothetical protein